MSYFAKYFRIYTKYKRLSICNCRFYNIFSDDIHVISVNQIKRILKEYNVQFEEGHTCIIAHCPICSKSAKSQTTSKLYINKTTGFFSCYSCKHIGPWNSLHQYFSAKDNEVYLKQLLKYAFTKDCDEYKSIMSSTKSLNKETDGNITAICKKFNFPLTSLATLKTLNLRMNESQSHLYIPLTDRESTTSGYRILETKPFNEQTDLKTLPTLEYSETTDPTTECSRVIDTKTLPATECSGIFVAKATRTRDGCGIIVPSLADALVLLEARVSGSVVCLPYGLQSLPLAVLPALERFTKLVLWFGNEVHAWDTARSFAKKLGEKRCYFVRPTDNQPLPHAAISTGHDIKSILANAQPIWHKSIITFASLREDILSDLQNLDRVQGIKWKRFPTLNRILKGHRRGELTVITGPTGCGKTTFISEYSLDLAMQGVNTLWGSFEIRNARLARTMLQQMAGCELDANLSKFDEWADRFELLPVYFLTFHGQQSIKVVMEAVEHATYVHDITHVIIDNVQFMMGITEHDSKHIDRFWKQDLIISAFRIFATRKNCHVTLVIHPRKERESDELTTSSIFGGAKATQEADNVLIIQDKRLTSVRGKKYLQIAKNRYSGDLGIVPMEFDKASLSYAQKKKKPEDASQPSDTSSLPVIL